MKYQVVKVTGNTEAVVSTEKSEYKAERLAVRCTYVETNKNVKYEVRPVS
jgi:hypothetical protein